MGTSFSKWDQELWLALIHSLFARHYLQFCSHFLNGNPNGKLQIPHYLSCIWIIFCTFNGTNYHFFDWSWTVNTGDNELTRNSEALYVKPGWILPVGLELIEADLGKSTFDLIPCLFHHRIPQTISDVPRPSASNILECSRPLGTKAAAPLVFGVLQWGIHLEPVCGSSPGQWGYVAVTTRPNPHDEASPAMEQPPVESRSSFYCLSSYPIYSSLLLLCIHFLSCPSCHICTVTSWFPIFNCPQRASSRATPAFVGALICHCPNWSSKHLKFSLYEHVVFLQVRD